MRRALEESAKLEELEKSRAANMEEEEMKMIQ